MREKVYRKIFVMDVIRETHERKICSTIISNKLRHFTYSIILLKNFLLALILLETKLNETFIFWFKFKS
jgi:hypothetical protein